MIRKILLGLTALAISSAAVADTIDFEDLADGNEGALAPNNVFALSGGGYLVITASGGEAYLDDESGGFPGGLGVCGQISDGSGNVPAGECADVSDDSVAKGQSLIFSFYADGDLTQAMTSTLADIAFRNGGHGLEFLGTIDVTDGSGTTQYNLSNPFNVVLSGSVITIAWDNDQTVTGDNINPYDFYISSVRVPEPGTIALFSLGLIGFGVARRKLMR